MQDELVKYVITILVTLLAQQFTTTQVEENCDISRFTWSSSTTSILLHCFYEP